LCGLKHACLHHYLNSGVFMLHRAAIKPDYLPVIMNNFMCAAEELLKCDFGSYVYITDSWGFRLVHPSEGSSKNAAFNFDALVVAYVKEGV